MEAGTIPLRIAGNVRTRDIARICEVITRLIDNDLFPWLAGKRQPTKEERFRAALIVADRDCGAAANPIIRNAQEQRQLAMISDFLTKLGYKKTSARGKPPDLAPGTFAIRFNVPVSNGAVNIPIDVVIQPHRPNRAHFPILIEAKSAGDFTNTNKRRKEEAQKIHQLRETYGRNGNLLLFLCGYFDTGYLGYEAAEGLDWIWEHRIDDMLQLGI
jgi:hypothetical protein